VTRTHRGRRPPPLGNVLVATDFSPGAGRAMERAARLPMGPGSVLTILHVLPAGVDPKTKARARAEAKRALATAAAATRPVAGGNDRRVVTRLAHGTAFVEIIRSARQGRAELIVLGRHGRRGFRELLLGSTAERVIRKGNTSTLVVSAQPTRSYVRPLVAVDLSGASRRALELALRVVDPGADAVEVVHAYKTAPESTLPRAGLSNADMRRYQSDSRRRARAAVARFLRSVRGAGRVRTAVRGGDARGAILDLAARRCPDLLALSTHGRSGLAYVLLGSVAEAVVRAAPCDVLVVRSPGRRFEAP